MLRVFTFHAPFHWWGSVGEEAKIIEKGYLLPKGSFTIGFGSDD